MKGVAGKLEAGLTLEGELHNWWKHVEGEVPDDSPRLTVNRAAYLQRDTHVPRELGDAFFGDVADRLSDMRPILWVTDPDTHLTLPHWPLEFSIPRIERLLAGDLSPRDLTKRERQTFLAIRLIVDERTTNSYRPGVRRVPDSTANRSAYIVVTRLINPYLLQGFGRYIRTLDSAGSLSNGDRQVPLRHSTHNEPFARLIHGQLARFVCELTQCAVKPSYSYLCVYKAGAILQRHTDRQQCEWNISMVVDMHPLMPRESSWPIYLELEEHVHPVRLGVGDAVIYRGREIPHWREKLPDGHEYTACLFHFVPAAFADSLD